MGRGSPDGATRQSGPSHSGEAPRGQSDAQARRIRSIGFLEASRGFKEASKKLQEASWRLQEASKRHPRGFQRLQEASRGFQEAFCFKSIVFYSLFLTGASNPLCFTGGGGATAADGRAPQPTREKLQEAKLAHRREGLQA